MNRLAKSRLGRQLAHAVTARSLGFLLEPLEASGAKIGLCDVGARGGPAAKLLPLARHARFVSVEGDAEEALRLQQQLATWGLFAPSDVHVLPHYLGSPDRSQATVHVTAEPGSSSIYEPVAHLVWPDCERVFQVVSRAECELVTLDDALERHAIESPLHYIKLDTQGSELDILRGATRTLENALVLEIEVELNPMYRSQPLFSDVDQWLRMHGFVLWRLGRLVHYGLEGATSFEPTALTVATDSRERTEAFEGGQLVWADAYWVRKDMAHGRLPSREMVLAGALISRVLGFRDLGDTVLRRHLSLFDDTVAASISRRLLPPWNRRQRPLPP
jgi:FkbM family methyltransferase